MRGCDRRIHFAAFVRDLMVTTEVRWGYTPVMLGLKKGEFSVSA